MGWETVKTFVRADGRRRLQTFRRPDGLFSFGEDQRVSDYYGEPCWTPFASAGASFPICDSAETAEREARARIAWLNERPHIST